MEILQVFVIRLMTYIIRRLSYVLGYRFFILHPESVTSKVLIQTTTRELVI